MNIRKFLYTGILCCYLVLVPSLLHAQTAHADQSDRTENQSAASPRHQPTTDTSEVPASRSTVSTSDSRLDPEITRLREKVDGLNDKLNFDFVVILVILTIFLAIPTITSVWSLGKVENRASEAHALAVVGERAAQNRASQVHDSFLQASKETLELVNATLGLAKQQSERAAKFVEDKARNLLENLDREARSIIEGIPSDDDKKIIADPENRSRLHSLAQRIAGFETNRLILPEDIRLTPYCLFIQGMDYHLGQQFDEAFKCWDMVALTPGCDPNLRSLAWHWIGIERNNLGQFAQAFRSFEKALENAQGARRWEFRRIAIESRFFNIQQEKAETLIEPLQQLLRNMEQEPGVDEIAPTKMRSLTTLGNVLWVVGNERKARGTEAIPFYEQSLKCFEEPAKNNIWAMFGRAEALHALGSSEAEKLFGEDVREAARDVYIHREEPRTKVLARATELICCVRVRRFRDDVPAIYSQVMDALGRVDERLTVYSQLQRRNVSKQAFRRDLEQIMFPPAPSGPAATVPLQPVAPAPPKADGPDIQPPAA